MGLDQYLFSQIFLSSLHYCWWIVLHYLFQSVLPVKFLCFRSLDTHSTENKINEGSCHFGAFEEKVPQYQLYSPRVMIKLRFPQINAMPQSSNEMFLEIMKIRLQVLCLFMIFSHLFSYELCRWSLQLFLFCFLWNVKKVVREAIELIIVWHIQKLAYIVFWIDIIWVGDWTISKVRGSHLKHFSILSNFLLSCSVHF